MDDLDLSPGHNPNQGELSLGVTPKYQERDEILRPKMRGNHPRTGLIIQALSDSSLRTPVLHHLPTFEGFDIPGNIYGHYDRGRQHVQLNLDRIPLFRTGKKGYDLTTLQHVAIHEAAHHLHRVLGNQFADQIGSPHAEGFAEGIGEAHTGYRRSGYRNFSYWKTDPERQQFLTGMNHAKEHFSPLDLNEESDVGTWIPYKDPVHGTVWHNPVTAQIKPFHPSDIPAGNPNRTLPFRSLGSLPRPRSRR